MLFCKTINLEEGSFDFCIDSRSPIDPNIHDLVQLHEITFEDESVYPNTIIQSNIVGIDYKLGLFIIGPRFNVYSGYVCDTTNIITRDIQHYLDTIDKSGASYKLTPTTSARIEKDIKWLDSFITKSI